MDSDVQPSESKMTRPATMGSTTEQHSFVLPMRETWCRQQPLYICDQSSRQRRGGFPEVVGVMTEGVEEDDTAGEEGSEDAI